MKNKFSPTILIDGKTITPKKYVWVLAYALAGCEWAIKEADKPEFREMIRTDLKQQKIKELEKMIKYYEEQISELKNKIKEENNENC